MKSLKVSQIKAGVLLSYIQTFISVIISLVYTPAMLSLLGKSEYGLYNIASTLISYVNLLNMGFSSSYVRFYSRDKAGKDETALARTNGLFCIVFAFIGILAFISGFVLIGFTKIIFGTGLTDSEYFKAKIIMTILTVSTAYNLGTSIFSSFVLAHERFVFHKIVNLIKTVLSPAVTWLLLLNGYKSIGMSVVTAVLTISADTFYMVYCFRVLKIKVNIHNPSKNQLKEITVFSGFIAVTTIVDQINWSIDKIILGRFWGTAYTAVYSVAATIQNLYTQMSTAVSNVFIPKVNKIVAEDKDKKGLNSLFLKIGRLQGMILFPILIGFIFFGKSFIKLWTPNGYGQAYYVALILMLSSTVPYIQNIGITVQIAQNKHKFRAYSYLCMAIVNLIISIVLCKSYGAVGVAIGTAVSLVVCNGIIMNIYYHKVIGLDMIEFWKSMIKFIPAVLATSVYGALIVSFINIDSFFKLLFFGAIFCLIYFVMLWVTLLTKDEKDSIIKKLKRGS